MADDRALQAALKVEASQIDLPADLLERILKEEHGVRPARRGLWSRLGPGLEVLAACIVLVGLIGIGSMRTANRTPADAGGAPAGATPPPEVVQRVLVDPDGQAGLAIAGFLEAAMAGDRDAARSYWTEPAGPDRIDEWIDLWYGARDRSRAAIGTPYEDDGRVVIPVTMLPRPAAIKPDGRTAVPLQTIPQPQYYFHLRQVGGRWLIAEISDILSR